VSHQIKIFFSEPGQNYKVVGTLQVSAPACQSKSALGLLEEEAGELGADAIIFTKAPSDLHIHTGPLYAKAIQFLADPKE
jgi:hypothetical protein